MDNFDFGICLIDKVLFYKIVEKKLTAKDAKNCNLSI
jgi:hypothetical protein